MPIKKIFFIHTIGTAGGDFTFYLQHLYNPSRFICAPDVKANCKINNPLDRAKYIEDTLKEEYDYRTKKGDQIDLIYGHIPYLEEYKDLYDKEFKLMTLVRNPVKRFVTHYRKYIYKNNSLKEFKNFIEDLTYFKKDMPRDANYMNFNLQTAFISGFNHHGTCHQAMTEETLNTAKKNICEFFFTGVADYFDESVKLFSKITDKKYIYLKPLNKYKGKNKITIDPDILKFIEEKSYYDFALYNYSKKRFFDQVEVYKNKKLINPSRFDNLISFPKKRLDLNYCKIKIKMKNYLFGKNIHI